MNDNALFRAPGSSAQVGDGRSGLGQGPGRYGVGGDRADIIQIDTALESMRDSGFDLTAAAGEPIDNSIDADATLIRVETKYGEGKRSIDELAFADNGTGIAPEIMAHALSLGFSAHYGQRKRLGRFGVGLEFAGLSLGRRIDIFSTQRGDDQIWHAHIDLDEIAGRTQTHIEARAVKEWPAEHVELMTDADGNLFDSGTLVLFGKIDRLTSGGHYGTALDQKISELRTFIARTYRFFLDKGLRIELNGKHVTLLDPLFMLDNPRIIKRYKPSDVRGVVIDEDDIEIAKGHSIHVTVTLAPPEFRHEEGDGGKVDYLDRDIREFQIDDSAGKISMVRNGREINYDIVPRLLPAGIDKPDRYIGIEVKFPADLDEFFQVRNVKRGAVPVMKLREELRTWLDKPVRLARKEIRRHWGDIETQEQAQAGAHEQATGAAARVEETSAPGQAGQGVTAEQAEQIINDVLFEDLQLTEADDAETIAHIRQEIEDKPFILVDARWSGSELFEINHLNGKAIIKINHRHPFWRDVYDPIKDVIRSGGSESSEEEILALLRKADAAIDALVLAYAKAENMHKDPSQYDQLRGFWGTFTRAYLSELLKEE